MDLPEPLTVSIAQYNKVLGDKQKLAATLQSLQSASKRALVEFQALKSSYGEVYQEAAVLKGQNEILGQKLSSLEASNKQQTRTMKRIVEAAKLAIDEFNELKLRFIEEYQRRVQVEEYCNVLLIRLEQFQNQPQALNSPTSPEEFMAKELAKVRVQLKNTLETFEQFKKSSDERQTTLEGRILDAGNNFKLSQPQVTGSTSKLDAAMKGLSPFRHEEFEKLKDVVNEVQPPQPIANQSTDNLGWQSNQNVKGNDFITNQLTKESNLARLMIDKRASRVYEAAGQRTPGSEYSTIRIAPTGAYELSQNVVHSGDTTIFNDNSETTLARPQQNVSVKEIENLFKELEQELGIKI